MQLDQSQSLLNLRLKLSGGRTELTLYAHHSLADAHHVFGLLEELFSRYTDVVATGDLGPVTPQPAPESLELVLEQRGMTKQQRSGLERFFPVMFAYDLPAAEKPARCWRILFTPAYSDRPDPAHRAGDGRPGGVRSCQSAQPQLGGGRGHPAGRVGTPQYPAHPDSLPLSGRLCATCCRRRSVATGSTIPMGVATYLAEIRPDTEIVDLARGIVETFRADLSDGVIQQSPLHFSLQYQGSPAGLPPVVLCTDAGSIPAVRTPEGMELDDFQSELHFPTRAPVDLYSCGTFADRLFIEHHAHLPGREKSLEAIHSLLCSRHRGRQLGHGMIWHVFRPRRCRRGRPG